MRRQRKSSARATRYPVRWPAVLGWSAGLLVAAATLAALGYLTGRKQSEPDGAPAAVLAAVSKPAVALAIAGGALLYGAWCVRHLLLHALSWLPGRIEVARFAAGTPLTDVDLDQATMAFRRWLATLHLQAPTPVPGAAPEGDFLDVLARNGTDARNIMGMLVNLARAAKPTHAYEVRGTLLERSERPRYGVVVQVRRLPAEGTVPVTVWGETWELALRKAADEATASILPRTRRCRAPWGVWRGHGMPAGLVHAFEEGARSESARRYDEALACYYEAVRLDPMNLALRLRIGQLQERLGLYLDALATYWGMWETAKPAGARAARRFYGGRGRRERNRALLSARYRRNVLLGGRVLADQWRTVPADPPSRRDEQRQNLRDCLRPRLEARLARPGDALADFDAPDEERYLRLRELLADFALRDCRRLRWRLRLRFYERNTLTVRTVKLTELCIGVRRGWINATRRNADAIWTPSSRRLWWRIFAIRHVKPFRRWHEHYNAACAYALPLQSERVPEDVRTQLTERAIGHLQKATARADSAFIASRRDWLLSEDPDLTGLRGTHAFEIFEVMYLPSGRTTPRRPRDVHRLESCRYVRDVLAATAERWQGAWQSRGDGSRHAGIASLRQWAADERRTWEGVRDVATHFRHSATRYAFISATQRCADRYGFEPLAVGFPRYEQNPLPAASCETACTDTVDAADARLSRLAEMLPVVVGSLVAWEACFSRFGVEGRSVTPRVIADLCRHYAALWQLLGEWLDASQAGEMGTAAAAFEVLTESGPRPD